MRPVTTQNFGSLPAARRRSLHGCVAVAVAALAWIGCGGADRTYAPPNPNPPVNAAPGAKPPWGGQTGPAADVDVDAPPLNPDIDGDGVGDGSSVPATGSMSFFVTSVGNGSGGGNFGGVAGADAFCNRLAAAAGAGGDWVAYVSTSAENARDRIGSGPWYNANGDLVATSVDALHDRGIPAGRVLSEKSSVIDMKNAHDVITGSGQDGTFAGDNCRDYKSASAADKTWVGHADGGGVGKDRPESWNAAHVSQGCDPVALQKTASQSHLYCFAK